jgi:hypothetical protein
MYVHTIINIFLFPFCIETFKIIDLPKNPCNPSPCGPNSVCRIVENHPVCSCSVNYYGTPPNCHSECLINSDCSQDRACIKGQCANPCTGTCGKNALCQVVNHNPICRCIPNHEGDHFNQCSEVQSKNRPLTYSHIII